MKWWDQSRHHLLLIFWMEFVKGSCLEPEPGYTDFINE